MNRKLTGKMFVYPVVVISAALWLCLFFIRKDLPLIFGNTLPQAIKVSGILNVVSVYIMTPLCSAALLYGFNRYFNLKIPLGDGKGVLIGSLIFGIITGVTVRETIKAKLSEAGYIECRELRRVSSRSSSRTYTVSPEVCQELSEKKR